MLGAFRKVGAKFFRLSLGRRTCFYFLAFLMLLLVMLIRRRSMMLLRLLLQTTTQFFSYTIKHKHRHTPSRPLEKNSEGDLPRFILIFEGIANMHPLVRNLYKEAIFVGRDYPLGLDKVRREWKKAIRNPENCPSCYNIVARLSVADDGDCSNVDRDSAFLDKEGTVAAIPKKMHSKENPNPDCERELRKAVGKGRYMIREMIGVVQLKKYRSLKRQYSNDNEDDRIAMFRKKIEQLQNDDDKKN